MLQTLEGQGQMMVVVSTLLRRQLEVKNRNLNTGGAVDK